MSLHLIIEGKVAVFHCLKNNKGVLKDIYLPDEFFGESAFILTDLERPEIAVAVEHTRVMKWDIEQVQELADKEPRLSLALLHLSAQRSADLAQRIVAFSFRSVSRRLATALLRFAERMGEANEDGSLRMIPLTHNLLSQYIGASREVVTWHMNHLRHAGCLRYSRTGISVYIAEMRHG